MAPRSATSRSSRNKHRSYFQVEKQGVTEVEPTALESLRLSSGDVGVGHFEPLGTRSKIEKSPVEIIQYNIENQAAGKESAAPVCRKCRDKPHLLRSTSFNKTIEYFKLQPQPGQFTGTVQGMALSPGPKNKSVTKPIICKTPPRRFDVSKHKQLLTASLKSSRNKNLFGATKQVRFSSDTTIHRIPRKTRENYAKSQHFSAADSSLPSAKNFQHQFGMLNKRTTAGKHGSNIHHHDLSTNYSSGITHLPQIIDTHHGHTTTKQTSAKNMSFRQVNAGNTLSINHQIANHGHHKAAVSSSYESTLMGHAKGNTYVAHQNMFNKPSNRQRHLDAAGENSGSRENRVGRTFEGCRLPLSPEGTLKTFGSRLTTFEQNEILDYNEIWFLGLEGKKIHGVQGASQNGGYDDENGSYVKVLHDHLMYRYEVLEVIGKGSFGQVVKAIDHKTNSLVAIKIIRNKKRFHHQAMVEVKILDALRNKDKDGTYNVIHMLEYFYFRNHLCITFELLGMNLYELIKKNNFQGFSLALIRRIAYALLKCLCVLYEDRIIHCDMKPENILIKQKGQSSIKVIDFGSSCYEHQREVILGHQYSMAIDMWSFGCILAELYTGYPLFPGENEVEQLACIMEVLGLPPNEYVESAQRRRLFFDSKGNPRCITNSKGRKRRPNTKDLSTAVRTNDPLFLDFLQRCLEWDPAVRMTPHEAMNHEWIMEGRFHKTRGQSRMVSRRAPQTTSSNINSNSNVENKNNSEQPFARKVHITARQEKVHDTTEVTADGTKPVADTNLHTDNVQPTKDPNSNTHQKAKKHTNYSDQEAIENAEGITALDNKVESKTSPTLPDETQERLQPLGASDASVIIEDQESLDKKILELKAKAKNEKIHQDKSTKSAKHKTLSANQLKETTQEQANKLPPIA